LLAPAPLALSEDFEPPQALKTAAEPTTEANKSP
jgi:hypothetical protein